MIPSCTLPRSSFRSIQPPLVVVLPASAAAAAATGRDGVECLLMRTLSVPLIDRASGALSSVLHVSDLRETGTCDSEELSACQSTDSW